MKERPILFSAPMVRAILDGAKTQTRRVVAPQPTRSLPHTETVGGLDIHHPLGWRWKDAFTADSIGGAKSMHSLIDHCRFGVAGDRLWVRETFAMAVMHDQQIACAYRASCPNDSFDYADHDSVTRVCVTQWKPSIHMPRWASRITLEVTDVRVERLQDISEEDARSEGAQCGSSGYWFDLGDDDRAHAASARAVFADLWQSINGKRAGCTWNDNPWVWVVSFTRIEQRENAP